MVLDLIPLDRREREMEGTWKGREITNCTFIHTHCVKSFIICMQEIGFTLHVFYEYIFTCEEKHCVVLVPWKKAFWKKYLPSLKKIQIYNDALQWKLKYVSKKV